MTSPRSRRYTAEELEKLKALAEKASPGPWRVDATSSGYVEDIIAANKHHVFCSGHDYDDPGFMSEDDAAYVAALSPDVALQLIAQCAEDAARLEQIDQLVPDLEGMASWLAGDRMSVEMLEKLLTLLSSQSVTPETEK